MPSGDQDHQKQEAVLEPGPDRGKTPGDDEQGGRRQQVLHR